MAKILVVDDDISLRHILSHILRQAGHETCEGSTAKEAIELAGAWRPDAIIIDVMMPGAPGEDGLTVCKRLKERKDSAAIPILVCTTHSRKEVIVRAKESGADDYILKPFTSETVVGKLSKALLASKDKVTTPP
jgi:two-component system alkaline phosphatase synthesis response regulator PhoP